ncbi:hypothetical protein D9758_004412 [Tetrapyrgos nigripes]|uniref:Uncharacterized protein n=1 Tax=Tetrapyrgos nigripes TaxID=182062 RepID=A0A8H5LST7_9AGAR|nr:hypothetical protein D9758_004412 [Tetrapyrgos nigripes]
MLSKRPSALNLLHSFHRTRSHSNAPHALGRSNDSNPTSPVFTSPKLLHKAGEELQSPSYYDGREGPFDPSFDAFIVHSPKLTSTLLDDDPFAMKSPIILVEPLHCLSPTFAHHSPLSPRLPHSSKYQDRDSDDDDEDKHLLQLPMPTKRHLGSRTSLPSLRPASRSLRSKPSPLHLSSSGSKYTKVSDEEHLPPPPSATRSVFNFRSSSKNSSEEEFGDKRDIFLRRSSSLSFFDEVNKLFEEEALYDHSDVHDLKKPLMTSDIL